MSNTEGFPISRSDPASPAYDLKCINAKCVKRLRRIPIEGSVPLKAVACIGCGQDLYIFPRLDVPKVRAG